MQRLAKAADQLSEQLKRHPNKLVRLRMAVTLGAFLIVRYMADLEYLYVASGNQRRPVFLLDLFEQRAITNSSCIATFICSAVSVNHAFLYLDVCRLSPPTRFLIKMIWNRTIQLMISQ